MRQIKETLQKILILLVQVTCCVESAHALPIGFGYNQGELTFMEMTSPNFIVYFDERAPADAKLALKALEAARPSVEKWFNVQRSSPLIVNISAASQNASFANFLTDSIELQTMGQGGRDLAWHEYVHSTMYRHFDNIFGPAGAIFHLPWMEAWFLEGLAEAISVAIGSDEQAGVERYQALSGQWPSWDRIHSLYTTGPFNYRGYATSGAFVSWILKTHGADRLPELLEHFRAKSMPWYWPWALTPLNGFLPMDSALRAISGKSGFELYEQYKIDATAHWKGQLSSPILLSEAGSKAESAYSWRFRDGKLQRVRPPAESASYQLADNGKTKAWIATYYPQANQQRIKVVLAPDRKIRRSLERDSTWIDGPWLSDDRVWWLETYVEKVSLCSAPQKNFKKSAVNCALSSNMPETLKVLGTDEDLNSKTTKTLWLSRSTERLHGDSQDILEVDLHTSQLRTLKSPVGGRPISLARAGDSIWMLGASRSWRHLIKLNEQFQCMGVVELSDFPVRIIGSSTNLPHVILFSSDGFPARLPDSNRFPLKPCRGLSERSSPLLAAMQSPSPISLSEAMQRSNIWSKNQETTPQLDSAESKKDAPQIEASTGAEPTEASLPEIKPAAWRGRPVLAFPWIGADDALGPQVGLISVPLMDHMQNETLRATVLVGTASRFPYHDVTLVTNRFDPTWSITAFRAQVYNGRYRDKVTKEILSGFVEEQGGRVDGFYRQQWKNLSLDYDWGIKSSHLKPYIGPTRRSGHLNEPYAGISATMSGYSRFYSALSFRTRFAPAAMNKVFQYDVVGGSVTGGSKVGKGKVEAALDHSRTRGPRRRELQEMYQPLKTLIPGTGAGLNQNSFALTEDHGLFSPAFGESQARARILMTHPIVENFDKFLGGLVYVDKMVGSGFFNYGTAWRGPDLPKLTDLTAAHGYSLDLFLDNKGVNFNMGFGTGQVLGRTWQAYWTFGFDALF